MWKIKVQILVFILLGNLAYSQSFGNEWIESDKSYYKLKVVEDGLYRVTATELSNAGVPVANIVAGRYQLFHKGKEVAIQVFDDNGDGRLDYFDFYGQKNDGQADTDLYKEPEAQPHAYYSLFTDTASYFLTWHLTSSTGKRMSFSSINDPGGVSPTTYHIDEELVLNTGNYTSGLRYGSGFDIQSGVYDYGEGWVSGNISKGNNRTYEFNFDDFDVNGTKPKVELVVHGISNLSHVTQVSVGPTVTSLRVVGELSFSERRHQYFSSDIEWSDLSATGDLVVRVTSVGVEGVTDVIAMAYVKVSYAQEMTIESGSKKFNIEDSDNARQYVTVSTANATSFRVFDVSNPANVARVARITYSDRLEFVFQDSTANKRSFLVTSEVKSVANIVESTISSLNVGAADYLIISNRVLNSPVNGVNPVTAYGNYRASAAGGGHNVQVVYMDQLYDQFGYGITSPIAIRNYLRYAQSVGDPQHVFLIGKATSPNLNYHRQESTTLIHHVPTFGYPGSDALFSVSSGQAGYTLPIGRINAFTASDVQVYLSKVQEMEAIGYDQLWRKNLIHLSGGQSPSELSAFSNYVNNFRSVATGNFLGGQVSTINKNSTDEVKVINVADEVNSGVSLITFFGHSSSVVTDMEIGRSSDPDAGYSNQGKYPIILVNGCNAGGIFGSSNPNNPPSSLTFGEDWIRTPNAGALGFIASSDLALSSNLKRYSDLFYSNAFGSDEFFGSSVGQIMKRVSDAYFNLYGANDVSQTQVYQTVLQGDPAVTVFGAKSPDFHLLSEQTYAEGFNLERVVANVDSFKVNLVIRNYGKTTDDSLAIRLTRTFADGTQREYIRLFESVQRQDTIGFTITNEQGDAVEGVNNFVINVDYENEIEELNESNNSGSFDLFIPRGNTISIYPRAFATVNASAVDLVWQSANMLEQERNYTLAIDTTTSFTSPFAREIDYAGQLLNAYTLDLSALGDSTTVFWRTRFAEAIANEDTNWVASSFTLVQNQPTGWAQVAGGQLSSNSINGVSLNPDNKALEFEQTSTDIQINTHGPNSTLTYEDYQVVVEGLNLLLTDNAADPRCKRLNAINAVFFDRETAQPFRPLGISGADDVFNDLVCGRLPQMIHNLNENDVLGANRYLDSLIKIIDDRDMVVLFSFGTVEYSKWDAQLVSSLNSIGIQSSTISSLVDGQPVVFVGRKGDAPGSAIELTSNGSTIPPQDQALELINTVTGKYSSGSMSSVRVGPASNWNSFHYNVKSGDGDNWLVNVFGLDESGNITGLESGSRIAAASEIDLSGVDVNSYPYLQFQFLFSDAANQTPPTLDAWGVSYTGVAEGIVSTSSIETEVLREGQEFSKAFYFTNISELSFSDSIDVNINLTNINSGDIESQELRLIAPEPGDTTSFDLATSTRGKVGENNVFVQVSTSDRENYYSNNALLLSSAFTVEEDLVNPVLDVTIDGNYILDGDIVSPSPQIRIAMKDENEYLMKDDTSGVSIEMRRACEGCVFERINLSSPEVVYTMATDEQDFEVIYQPGSLEDGLYTLRVQVADESGNKSGVEPYEVSFEVINESTITHFYPYPNPFSTSTRFVFTLTGSVIPDQIKIQIMTVSGRVVREITQDEIGPIKIGNNITQYAWDGRDEYGDQLANGVYLYKVFIQQNGESIDHRITSGDRGFTNGFGKIYLLR